MLTQASPEKVSLIFRRVLTDEDPGEPAPLMVEAIDAGTGNTIHLAPLHDCAAWLKREGYQWMAGTQAVWRKAA